jgi:outer membrane protein assembly factor BamB
MRRYHFCIACILSLCAFGGLAILASSAAIVDGEEWPQWRGPTRDGVWTEKGLIEKFPAPQIKIRWKAEISSGYSGPTVADGRVYVTDRITEPQQQERVHCFDWQTGDKIWSYVYDCVYEKVGYAAGPRASVSVNDGRAYSLGSMGHLFCFDAKTGNVNWHKNLYTEYKIDMPIWGISASPLVEGDLVIVQIGGSPGACLVAFDKRTGTEKWRAMNDKSSYAAPIMIEQAGQRVMVCWTGDHVAGLDPATGKIYWEYSFPPQKMVISIATPVVLNDRLFVTSFYDGSLMLKLASDKLAVEKVWQRMGRDEKHTDALHSIISTPYLEGDYVYGVDSYGELRCLDAKTGDRLWEDKSATPFSRWSTIHMVKNGDKMWMFNERGELIIGKLSPKGFEEISRAKLLDPTKDQLNQRGGVCWSHPAYAYKHVFARNDNELVCASLAAE